MSWLVSGAGNLVRGAYEMGVNSVSAAAKAAGNLATYVTGASTNRAAQPLLERVSVVSYGSDTPARPDGSGTPLTPGKLTLVTVESPPEAAPNQGSAAPLEATKLPLVNQKYRSTVYLAGAVVAGSVGLLFTSVPAITMIAQTVLVGFGYGLANDLIACKECPEYFTVGHVYDGKNLAKRLVNTLDVIPNAIVWGAAATWPTATIAGSLLSMAAAIPGKIGRTLAPSELLIPTVLLSSLVFIKSHLAAKYAYTYRTHCPEGVEERCLSGWSACAARNQTGYKFLGCGTAALVPIILLARAFLPRLTF